MAKRLNTNVFCWKHGSKYVISTGIPRTSSQNKHIVPNPFSTAILVRKGKTTEFSTVIVHKVHKNLEQWIL